MPLRVSAEVFIESLVPSDISEPRLSALVAFGLAAEGATGNWHVEVALADDALLQRLHRDFMGLDSPTDIMTFPDHHPDAEPPAFGGQIVISVERAAEQAPEFGQSVSEEILFLVLHGILHLCGWNDDTDDKRERMLERQSHLLRAFERERLG